MRLIHLSVLVVLSFCVGAQSPSICEFHAWPMGARPVLPAHDKVPSWFAAEVRWPWITVRAGMSGWGRYRQYQASKFLRARLDRPGAAATDLSGVVSGRAATHRLNLDGSLWLWSSTKLFFVSVQGVAREVSDWSSSVRVLRSGPRSLLLSVNGSVVLRRLTPQGLGDAIPLTANLETWRGPLDVRPRTLDPDYWFASRPCSMMHRQTGEVTQLMAARAVVSAKVGNLVFAVQEADALLVDVETKSVARCRSPLKVIHASPLGIVHVGSDGAQLWDPVGGRRWSLPQGVGHALTWSPLQPGRLTLRYRPRGEGRPMMNQSRSRGGRRLPSFRPPLVCSVTPGRPASPKSTSTGSVLVEQGGEQRTKQFESLVAAAKTADRDKRTRALRRIAFGFGDRAREVLHAALARALEEKSEAVLECVFECFAVAGAKEDSLSLVAAGKRFAPKSLARTLAILGDQRSLEPLRRLESSFPKSEDYVGRRRVFAESIALLKERLRFEEISKRTGRAP